MGSLRRLRQGAGRPAAGALEIIHSKRVGVAYTTCETRCHGGFIRKIGRAARSGPAKSAEKPRFQSVIAIARRARRSRAESFSVALLSWPQAARMSRPRGVRTGEA